MALPNLIRFLPTTVFRQRLNQHHESGNLQVHRRRASRSVQIGYRALLRCPTRNYIIEINQGLAVVCSCGFESELQTWGTGSLQPIGTRPSEVLIVPLELWDVAFATHRHG